LRSSLSACSAGVWKTAKARDPRPGRISSPETLPTRPLASSGGDTVMLKRLPISFAERASERMAVWVVVASTSLAAFFWTQPSMARGEWPDGPYKSWFENLQRPDNHLNPQRDEKSRYCCGIADVVDTRFKVESSDGSHPDDTWYAWLNEKWVRIPPEKIVADFAPNGRAYLFLLGNSVQCFVRPRGGL
jgi:hypothetical protein